MSYSPVALFVYNRLYHTRQTIAHLQKNSLATKSDLFIFSDAAKNLEAQESIEEIRKYIKNITGFKSITIIEREKNLGLANSIIDGVTHLCDEYGQVIVLEDDLITSQYFLAFLNNALNYYRNHNQVVSIDCYMYPIKEEMPETFFLKDPGCWGWATWQRGWKLFEPNGSKLLKELKEKKLEEVFDYDNSYPYTKMLENQVLKQNDSWAIRWYASVFLKDKLVLHVGKSLVANIGNDSSGTHGGKTDIYDVELNSLPVDIKEIALKEDSMVKKKIAVFLSATQKCTVKSFFSHFLSIIRQFLENVT